MSRHRESRMKVSERVKIGSVRIGSYELSLNRRITQIEPRVVTAEAEQYLEQFVEQRYNELFNTVKFDRYKGLKAVKETRNFLLDVKNPFGMLCLRAYCDRTDILSFLSDEQVGTLIHELGKSLLDLKRPVRPCNDIRQQIKLTEPLAEMAHLQNGNTVYYHGLVWDKRIGMYIDVPESYMKKTVKVEEIDENDVYDFLEAPGWSGDLLMAQMYSRDLMLAHRLEEVPTETQEYMYILVKEPQPTPEPEPEEVEVPEALSQI